MRRCCRNRYRLCTVDNRGSDRPKICNNKNLHDSNQLPFGGNREKKTGKQEEIMPDKVLVNNEISETVLAKANFGLFLYEGGI